MIWVCAPTALSLCRTMTWTPLQLHSNNRSCGDCATMKPDRTAFATRLGELPKFNMPRQSAARYCTAEVEPAVARVCRSPAHQTRETCRACPPARSGQGATEARGTVQAWSRASTAVPRARGMPERHFRSRASACVLRGGHRHVPPSQMRLADGRSSTELRPAATFAV